MRTTAAAADPCHEDLTCCVVSDSCLPHFFVRENFGLGLHYIIFYVLTQERSSLLKGLSRLKDIDIKNVSDSNNLEEPISITGLETFSLSYKVCVSFVVVNIQLIQLVLLMEFLDTSYLNDLLAGV